MKAQCANCEWTGDAGDCDAINDLWERVEPGEIMPAGECPECGSLAHLERPPVPVRDDAAALREALETICEAYDAHGYGIGDEINAARALIA